MTTESGRWRLRREERRRWSVLRRDERVAELGPLFTGEWWVRPDGESLPWAETYPTRAAALRAVIVWWVHTHPFPRGDEVDDAPPGPLG